MRQRHVIVGLGEVGKALHEVLTGVHEVWGIDLGRAVGPSGQELTIEEPFLDNVRVLHICLNAYGLGKEKFTEVVNGYLKMFQPRVLDICSTVWPGTTETFGSAACHSTTRGLHPNLASGLRTIVKHIGGPHSEALAVSYRKAGVRCQAHLNPRTTELAHILNNSAYGAALMFADEMAKLCRAYGVDYNEAVMRYTETHNEGFRLLDHPRLVRPVLTPPGGRIGGHCVQQGATLIPNELRGPILESLAHYNGPEPVRVAAERLGVLDGSGGTVELQEKPNEEQQAEPADAE